MTRPRPFERPVYVARPVLPPIDAYTARLARVWETSTLTNLGPMHEQLESAITERLGRGRVSLWSSGTAALLGSLQALELQGSAIVTPFTFPATVHAARMLGLDIVFADVVDDGLTLDPASVADRVDADVSVIIGTHVYGSLCDTAGLSRVARDAGLRVLYDGAHSFGRVPPLFPDTADSLGDLTVFSFHATKLFHTAEGGAVATDDAELDGRLRLVRNFGIRSEDEVDLIGLNGKLSELHAAMGLAVLPLLESEFERRRELGETYCSRLADVPGISVIAGDRESLQYFVVRVDRARFGSTRDELHATLRAMNIVSRKYFFPLCADLPPYRDLPSARDLPVARRAADEVLALPLHGGLSTHDVERIADTIVWHRSGGRP